MMNKIDYGVVVIGAIGFSLLLTLMIILGIAVYNSDSGNREEINEKGTELVNKNLTTVSNYSRAIVLEKYEEKRSDTTYIITNPTNRNYFLTLKKYRKGSFGHWDVFTIRVSRFEYIKYNPGDTIK